MNSEIADISIADAQRQKSYTTPRPDIFAMVPSTATSILDVGCSNGALGRSLKMVNPGRIVSGIECDVDFAKEAAAILDNVVLGDLNTLEWSTVLADQTFDCIIFADVLEHLREPVECLLQATEHLRAGGCVVVSLPNIRHVSALQSIFLRGRFPRVDRGIFDRTHLRWFTISDAHALVTEAGLHVTSTVQALRWGDQGGGLANKLLNRLPIGVQRFAPIREFLTYQTCLLAYAAN